MVARASPCMHVFHDHCLRESFRYRTRCPLCQGEIIEIQASDLNPDDECPICFENYVPQHRLDLRPIVITGLIFSYCAWAYNYLAYDNKSWFFWSISLPSKGITKVAQLFFTALKTLLS